jgi:Sigma-70 region 2
MSRPSDDPEARFRRLFNETRHDLLAYAIRRSKRPEDAADVVAETYLIAWQKLNSLPEGGEARLCLFGTARNVILRGASREHALRAVVDRLALELHDLRTTTEPADAQLPANLRAALEALRATARSAPPHGLGRTDTETGRCGHRRAGEPRSRPTPPSPFATQTRTRRSETDAEFQSTRDSLRSVALHQPTSLVPNLRS